MHFRSLATVMGLSLAFVATNAEAHILMMNPSPVTTDDNAKSGPCGCYFGAGPEDPNEDGTALACPTDYKTTSLVAGSQLQVAWKETVNHTGKFRIAVSVKPIKDVTRADLDAAVESDENDANGVNGGLVSKTITVPDTPCTNCVLQLRQFMEGAAKPYYYTCAAINITSATASSSSSSGSASSSSSGGGGGGGGTGGASGTGGNGGNENVIGAGPAPLEQPHVSGACSASPLSTKSSTSIWLTLAGLFVLTLRRKSSARV